MSRKVLGLDIRNHCVAAVLVECALRENRIIDHGYVPVTGHGDDNGGVRTALQTVAADMDLKGCDAVVSMAADQCFYRNLQIPFGNPKKIRLVLPFELESTLPVPVDGLAVDFLALETPDSSDHTDLIAAAVEKSRLQGCLDLVSELKIDPEAVTISGLPVALCLADRAAPREQRLVVEIDREHAALFVLGDGQIQLVRSFPIPASPEAKPGVLCANIQRTLAALDEMAGSDFRPLEVVVTGCGLEGLTLEEDMAEILDVAVSPASLADRLGIAIENHPRRSWTPARMDNALALAMMEIEQYRGLNFHRGHFAAQKFLSRHRDNFVKTGILAAVVLLLAFVSILGQSYVQTRRLKRLEHQVTAIFKATFPGVKRIVDPYQQMKARVQAAKKNPLYQVESERHIRSIDILNSISERIPQKTAVDIKRLVIGPTNVLIAGDIDSFNAVDAIKGQLEQIDFFKKVTISSANIDRSSKKVRFMIKVDL